MKYIPQKSRPQCREAVILALGDLVDRVIWDIDYDQSQFFARVDRLRLASLWRYAALGPLVR